MSERAKRRRKRRGLDPGPFDLGSEDAEFTEAMATFDASGAWPALSERALSEKAPSEKSPSQAVRPSGAKPMGRRARARALLKAQKMSIETLDLHGASVQEALERLERFLVESMARDRRRVLVITGQGRRSSGGLSALRKVVGPWLLREGRAWVRETEKAPQEWGGEGAFLVHLMRPRPR